MAHNAPRVHGLGESVVIEAINDLINVDPSFRASMVAGIVDEVLVILVIL
jgi:hypothetical protein